MDGTGGTPKKDEPFDEAKQAKFLADFRKWGNVSHACRAASVGRSTAYRHYREDDAFKAEWDDAKEEGIESLEHEAWRRAKAQSDTLLIFLLKSHKPKVYREPVQRFAETDAEGNDKSGLTDDELLEKAAAVIQKRKAGVA